VIVAPTQADAEASYRDQIQIYQNAIEDLRTQLQTEQDSTRKQRLKEEIETFEALKKQAQARYEAWKSVNRP
jgi:TolA-binding protein